jgi:hypothetical protein
LKSTAPLVVSVTISGESELLYADCNDVTDNPPPPPVPANLPCGMITAVSKFISSASVIITATK